MNEQVPLHIFVNRRRFGSGDGVKREMKGKEIAALVKVPEDNAVVRREKPPLDGEIGMEQSIRIEGGEHFLVTRRVVEGG
jgi:hypothetical protein